MLSRRSTEIDRVLFANVGEDFFYGGEQSMFISIVMWLYPFPFQYSPKSFGDIEVWGVRREIEYVETSVLPSLQTVLDLAALNWKDKAKKQPLISLIKKLSSKSVSKILILSS